MKILYNGRKAGSAELTACGNKIHITACVPEAKEGPFRLAATAGGKQYPLGVMMPAEGTYRLERTFSRLEAERALPEHIEGFLLVYPEDESSEQEICLSRKYGVCPELEAAFEKCSAIKEEMAEGLMVTINLKNEKISAIMPFFCLASLSVTENDASLIFCFPKE